MDRIRKALMLVCILALSMSVHAQANRVVEGMLRDTESRPISGATVYLMSATDTLKTSSTNAGFFTFNNVAATKFTIRVSSLGFEAVEKEVEFPEGQKEIRVPSFALAVNSNQIEEVVVAGVLTVQVKATPWSTVRKI